MTHETLACSEGVNPERLSALRHGSLSTAEAERLRAHVADCAACQARLAELETALGALRAERDLDPGDRVIEGVRARIASQPGGARGRVIWNLRTMSGGRRLWAGLAAMAPVAALILLFVYVFSGIARHPATSATPTVATATPFGQKPIVPSPTPMTVQVPTFTPAVSAAQAWPTFNPAIDVTFKPNGSEEFIPNVFSSDLSAIGGVLFNASDSGAGAQMARLAYYTVATGAITKLGPTWRGDTGPWGGMTSIDGRFIVYGFNSQPGATCGVCNNTIWSLDRATGKTWEINAGRGGDLLEYTSADHVAFASVNGQVWVADLAAHTVKVALPINSQPYTASSQPAADERLLGFQWPYLLYAEAPAATPPAQSTTTLNILDMATGVNTPVTSTMYDQSGNPVDPGSVTNLALVGKMLYAVVTTGLNGVDAQGKPVNLTYSTLYRLDDGFNSTGKFIAVAFSPGGYSAIDSPTMATRHFVWLGSGYFWDNAELRLVSTSLDNAELVGPYIVNIEQQTPGAPLQTYSARAYDTSGFPTPPGW